MSNIKSHCSSVASQKELQVLQKYKGLDYIYLLKSNFEY